MSSSDFPPNPQYPSGDLRSQAPPLDYGEPVEPQPTWPMVIGIVAIVFGGLGLLMYGCGGVWNVIFPFVMDEMMPGGAIPPDQEQMLEAQKGWMPITGIVSIVIGLISFLLLFGGIQLCRRKKSAVKFCKTWAVLKLAASAMSIVVNLMMQMAMVDAMETMGASSPRGASVPWIGFGEGMFLLIAAISLIWFAALPVFLLIWFAREKIKTDVDKSFE